MKAEAQPGPGQLDFAAGDFQDYLNGILHDWLRTMTALACAMVPFFFILDYFTMPSDLLTRFGIYRLASTLVVAGQLILIRNTEPSSRSFYHGYLVSINIGGVITLMTVDLGGFNSSYYAGLNLVIMGVNLLLPWKAAHSLINSIIVISMYLVFNLLGGADYSRGVLVNHLFFLFATAVIATSINHLRYKLVRKEFDLLVELKKARDALWSEMEIAKKIQTALLPAKRKVRGLDLAAIMIPAREVGGDYYDIIETARGEKWVVIGDVSGHGIDSGLIMMMAQTSVQSMVNNVPGCRPSQVLSSVNSVLRENISRLGSDYYMTMTALFFNGQSLIVSGKHQDLIIYRARTNQTEVVSTRGTWLGIADEIEEFLEDQSVYIGLGDIVLLFTDGITEATGPGGEIFGQRRLEQALGQFADLPVGKLLEKIIEQVNNYQEEQNDDMTLVVMERVS